ncbi:MAG: SH3 domain-containing protein, partial [Anaerolineae bacterium]|nr:SH3 domain-containing protein [Anaerolineae bacterium]
VSVQARQYTITADGSSITDNTEGTSNPQFGVAPAAAAQSIPDGVIAGSEYSPGQQLRVAVDYLNLRSEPSTSSAVQGGLVFGDYVAIIAGPYDNEGYRWWQAQTADERVGWLAGAINGAPTLQRP